MSLDVTFTATGPTIAGKMRGVKYIEVGIIQDVTVTQDGWCSKMDRIPQLDGRKHVCRLLKGGGEPRPLDVFRRVGHVCPRP